MKYFIVFYRYRYYNYNTMNLNKLYMNITCLNFYFNPLPVKKNITHRPLKREKMYGIKI